VARGKSTRQGVLLYTNDMKKTYQGSCHCGAIRFEADIDLAQETLRCNCTYCRKIRSWAAIVPHEALRLLSGEGQLREYRFHTKTEQHLFCGHCGVRPYGIGKSPRWGPFYAVNIGCLDDVSEAELAAVPIRYVDGRGDNWDAPPRKTGYL